MGKITIKEFRINKYLSLRLIKNETEIYVSDKPFKQCKYLLLNKKMYQPNDKVSSDSIDSLEQQLDHSMNPENPVPEYKKLKITPEEEFWAHCSNLQVWAENDYSTHLLHRELAFPLLEELSAAGDLKALKIFRKEIIERYNSGDLTVANYLYLEGYLDLVSREDLIIDMLIPEERDLLLKLEKLLDIKFFLLTKERQEISNFRIENKRVVGLTLGNIDLVSVPDVIFKLSGLKHLNFDNNHLESLPDLFGDLVQLETLSIRNNLLKDLPESIGTLKNLKILDLSHNKFQILPECVFRLKSLVFFNITKNNVSFEEQGEIYKRLSYKNSRLAYEDHIKFAKAGSESDGYDSDLLKAITTLKTMLERSENVYILDLALFSGLPPAKIHEMLIHKKKDFRTAGLPLLYCNGEISILQ